MYLKKHQRVRPLTEKPMGDVASDFLGLFGVKPMTYWVVTSGNTIVSVGGTDQPSTIEDLQRNIKATEKLHTFTSTAQQTAFINAFTPVTLPTPGGAVTQIQATTAAGAASTAASAAVAKTSGLTTGQRFLIAAGIVGVAGYFILKK